jgi:hypothetical protein
MAAPFELTILTKANGEPLTKHIHLDAAGHITNDSSACGMARGTAERFQFEDAKALAAFFTECRTDQALALGRLRSDIADKVDIVVKKKLDGAAVGTIARTKTYIGYRDDAPAWVLIDFDRKGMPLAVADRITELGGVEAALLLVCPEIVKAARVIRASTSAGIKRTDTGEVFDGIGGMHIWIAVGDGSDIVRFLKTLHERCWLAGLGWHMLDVAGRMLERSLVDRMVGSPERLQFEGPARLDWPLEQDADSRRPVVILGVPLDTKRSCPPLDYIETAKLDELRAAEAARLRPEADRVRKVYIAHHAEELMTQRGLSKTEAIKIITRRCEGILRPDLVLPFDDSEFEGCTVADVLADPERFHEATLADPIDGIAYGRDKAKLFVNADGSIVIHSFAHGRTMYRLCWDYRHALAIAREAGIDEVTQKFIECMRNGDLDPVEAELLRNTISKTYKIGKKALKDALKEAQEQAAETAPSALQEEQLVIAAAGRPVFPEPHPKDEWEPVVQQINQVLVKATRRLPAARDVEHHILIAQTRELPKLHILTSKDVNIPATDAGGEDDDSAAEEEEEE